MANDQLFLNPEGAVVQDPNDNRFFSKRERQVNIDLLLAALDNTDFDFETMIYAACDFFQSVFLNGIISVSSSEEEVNQSLSRITRTANRILDAFDQSDTSSTAEDFAALMTVALDLTDHTLKAQREEGTRP